MEQRQLRALSPKIDLVYQSGNFDSELGLDERSHCQQNTGDRSPPEKTTQSTVMVVSIESLEGKGSV